MHFPWTSRSPTSNPPGTASAPTTAAPGVDALSVSRFAAAAPRHLAQLLQHLTAATYRPLPLLRIVYEKDPATHTTRTLLVPTVRDRIAQTAVASRLSASFEEEFLESSFAYRPSRGVDRAIARTLQLRDLGYTYALRADISSYFDQVSHSLLETRLIQEHVPEWVLTLIHSWLHAGIWDGHHLHPLRKGLPQGSPLSPVLSNFFLHEFDIYTGTPGTHLIRYADDFLVLCDSPAGAASALTRAQAWMAAHALALHPSKTYLTSFKEGFTFLGVYLVNEQAYRPWKQNRATGRLVSIARPMPPHMLGGYLQPAPQEPQLAAGLRHALIHSSGEPFSTPLKGTNFVAYLYLTEQGSVLRKSGDRFLVEKDGTVLLDLPYHKLESVLVFGNIQITTQSLGELLEKNIAVSFFSRIGRFRGTLSTPQGKDIPLRLAQFRRFTDAGASLHVARAIVQAKIQNSLLVLRSLQDAIPAETSYLEEAAAQTAQCLAVDSLLGVEGSASRMYFEALMKFNRSGLEWKGRARHPPPDPLNALLSFAYTLLSNEIRGLLEAHGLDPYLGCLHQPDYGRASLALDMVETFRAPVADRFVLTQINRRVFQPKDFQPHGDSAGVWLNSAAMVRFIERWEAWMSAVPAPKAGVAPVPSLRRELRREVERFVRELHRAPNAGAAEDPWKAWIWDRVETPEELECDSSSVTT